MIKLAPKLKTKSKDMTVATVTRAAELAAKQFGALETEVHRVDLEERGQAQHQNHRDAGRPLG
jgi:hypothetical protein